MDDKPKKRPCMKCRKPFMPKDRKRDWYCDPCRHKLLGVSGLRECRDPTDGDLPCDPGGYNGDNW